MGERNDITPNVEEPDWTTDGIQNLLNALLGEKREDLKNADDWRNPKNWRVSINQLEFLLNNQAGQSLTYDFLSNVPLENRDALKNDRNFPFPPPLTSASLMAESKFTNLSEVSEVNISGLASGLHQPYRTDNKFSIKPSSITNEDIAFSVERIDIGMLEVATNGTGRFNTTTSLSPSQITTAEVGMIPVVGADTNQPTIPHITTDEFSRQLTFQNGILQVDVAKISTAQINRSQVNPTQVNSMQDNISEISFPISITLEQFLGINNFGGVGFNSSIWHNSVAENSPFRGSNTSQISIPQVTTNQFSFPQISTTEVSTGQINTNQSSTFQTRSSEIGVTQVTINQRSTETSPFQTGISKVGINQIGDLEQTVLQIDSAEINVHKTGVGNNSTLQLDASKVSLPSFITFNNFLSQSTSPDKFFKFIHNIPATSKINVFLFSSNDNIVRLNDCISFFPLR